MRFRKIFATTAVASLASITALSVAGCGKNKPVISEDVYYDQFDTMSEEAISYLREQASSLKKDGVVSISVHSNQNAVVPKDIANKVLSKNGDLTVNFDGYSITIDGSKKASSPKKFASDLDLSMDYLTIDNNFQLNFATEQTLPAMAVITINTEDYGDCEGVYYAVEQNDGSYNTLCQNYKVSAETYNLSPIILRNTDIRAYSPATASEIESTGESVAESETAAEPEAYVDVEVNGLEATEEQA